MCIEDVSEERKSKRETERREEEKKRRRSRNTKVEEEEAEESGGGMRNRNGGILLFSLNLFIFLFFSSNIHSHTLSSFIYIYSRVALLFYLIPSLCPFVSSRRESINQSILPSTRHGYSVHNPCYPGISTC